MPSRDLLEKLFDVEREAELMVSEARAEAGRRLDAAKARAQKYYTEAYDAALAKALESRERAEESARAEYEAAIRSYRERLDSSTLDRPGFETACASALGEGR
jgi:vacuolar-type H+-ATPase subunit H